MVKKKADPPVVCFLFFYSPAGIFFLSSIRVKTASGISVKWRRKAREKEEEGVGGEEGKDSRRPITAQPP